MGVPARLGGECRTPDQGVKSVSCNLITIEPQISAADVKHQIEEAFVRSAQLDANRISVETRGSEVVLKGKVRSWAEHDEAQNTAWAAPGVTSVKNEISVNIV